MNPWRILIVMTPVLAVIWWMAAVVGYAEPKEIIRVKGLGEVAETVSSRAEEFMRSHAGCNIVASGGSRIDWQALADKDSEIIMTSRRISDAERESIKKKGISLDEAIIGYGGVAVILSPENPVTALTLQQVRKIFTGGYETWTELGGKSQRIAILSIDENRSGLPESLRREFLGGPFARNTQVRSNAHSVISAVYWESNATALVRVEDLHKLKPQDPESKIKVAAVKADDNSAAVPPTPQTVSNGTYPLKIPYYLYMDTSRSTPLAREFFHYCASQKAR